MKLTPYAVILLAGCAANSGVVPMGGDTYMVSRQAPTGFTGAGTIKAEALQEAGQHCTALKRDLLVVNITEAQPPFILGNYPRAEVQFRCVETRKKPAEAG